MVDRRGVSGRPGGGFYGLLDPFAGFRRKYHRLIQGAVLQFLIAADIAHDMQVLIETKAVFAHVQMHSDQKSPVERQLAIQ
jgi:hypothetical protein